MWAAGGVSRYNLPDIDDSYRGVMALASSIIPVDPGAMGMIILMSQGSSMRSGRELGRVELPTLQRRLALSGKLCFNSLWPVTNVSGQGNGKLCG